MELIVIFNAGRDAYRAGRSRKAPNLVNYPGHEFLRMDEHCKREWLRGYDHQAAQDIGLNQLLRGEII